MNGPVLLKPSQKARSGKKKRKVGKTALASSYGLIITYWRYQGLKGIFWYLFSMFIRMRDFNRWGVCVACSRPVSSWREFQAGHYAPAGDCGFDLLFDEDNVHGECPHCNNPRFSPGKLILYRKNLVLRYGEAYVQALDERYQNRHKTITKEWSQNEYRRRIAYYQEQLGLEGSVDV